MVSLLRTKKNDSLLPSEGDTHRRMNIFRRLREKARHHSHIEEEEKAVSSKRTPRLRTSTFSVPRVKAGISGQSPETPKPSAIPTARPRNSTSALPMPTRYGERSATSLGHSALVGQGAPFKRDRVATINTSNMASSITRVGLPSINDYQPKTHKMKYNPYGLGNMDGPSRVSTASSVRNNTHMTFESFDDEANILPYPVDSPNKHLPAELAIEHENLLDEFVFVNKTSNLGTGASALVKKVHRIGHPKDIYAVKKFVLFKGEKPDEFYERASKEYIIHHNLNAGFHVVTCYSLVKISHQRNLARGWGLLMELCRADLFDVISKPGFSHVSNGEKMCLFKQVVYGVKYMHDFDIAHRDLKPENILLTSDGIVKITDFGVAEYGHEIPGDFSSPLKMSKQIVGSSPYQPPEVEALKNVPREKRSTYDMFQMDHWALGVILFVLFYGDVPFDKASDSCSAFRDYEQVLKEYSTRINPDFKKTNLKGPGIEYRFARKFMDMGIARLAWRLVDPDPKVRYRLYDLFSDRAFQQAEMCVDEKEHACNFCHLSESKDVAFKYPLGSDIQIPRYSQRSISSSSSSTSNYVMSSRKGTLTGTSSRSASQSSVEVPKLKSMIDIAAEARNIQRVSSMIPRRIREELLDSGVKVTLNPKLKEGTKAEDGKLQESKKLIIEEEKEEDGKENKDNGDSLPRVAEGQEVQNVKTVHVPSEELKDKDEPEKRDASLKDNKPEEHDGCVRNDQEDCCNDCSVPQPESAAVDYDNLLTIGGFHKILLSDTVQDGLRPLTATLTKSACRCMVKRHNHISKW